MQRDVSEALNISDYNTAFVIKDKNGNVKLIWQDNALGLRLLSFFRKLKPDFSGKSDLLSKLATFGVRVPVLTGYWSDMRLAHNTITNVGHAAANGRISNQGSYNPFVNIAVGTGTQGTPATATALAVEATTDGMGRSAATASQVTTSVTNDTMQLTHTWTSTTGTITITEEGIFDSASASSGNMLAYQSFSGIALNGVNGDQLTITHKIQT